MLEVVLGLTTIVVVQTIIIVYLIFVKHPMLFFSFFDQGTMKITKVGRIYDKSGTHLKVLRKYIIPTTVIVPPNAMIESTHGDDSGFTVFPIAFEVKRRFGIITRINITEYLTNDQIKEFSDMKSILGVIEKQKNDLQTKTRETLTNLVEISNRVFGEISSLIDVSLGNLRQTLKNVRTLTALISQLHGVDPQELDTEKLIELLERLEGGE